MAQEQTKFCEREIGLSVQKTPIMACHIDGKEPNAETIHFYGGFHGDEPESVDLALNIKNYLLKNALEFEDKRIVIVPVVNPDGYQKRERVNANGVDLNRNFPTRDWTKEVSEPKYHPGKGPGSEPETMAIVRLINDYPPKKIITLHSLIPHQINYDGPGKALAQAMAKHNQYPVTEHIGYPTLGSLGAFAGHERNIAVITYELPEKVMADVAWKESYEAILAAIRFSL